MCFVTVDDATHRSVTIVTQNSIGDDDLTRILGGVCSQRGTPAVIRTDNCVEFTANTAQNLTKRKNANVPPLIQTVKPSQRYFAKSFDAGSATTAPPINSARLSAMLR
jgi:hypothetical protein